MTFENFTKSKLRNAWIEEPHMLVYVRKSIRLINNKQVSTIDVASVQVNEKYQRKGLFTKFLKKIEKYAKKNALIVFVESVLNIHLVKYLEKNGYISTPTSIDICPDYYK